MKTTQIVLLGYMGSGKTAVGELLNEQLRMEFLDLDHYIEQKFNTPVTAIFEQKGELFFRAEERKALEELLQRDTPLILSLGGGTPCYYDTMEYLKGFDKLKTVYLQTGIRTLSERLEKAKGTRPLLEHLKDLDQIKEFVGKHLFERNPFYLQADYKIVTDHKSVETVALEIQNTLT